MDIDSKFQNLNLKSPEDGAPMQMDAEESAQVKVQTHLEFDQISDIYLFIELVLLSDFHCFGGFLIFWCCFQVQGQRERSYFRVNEEATYRGILVWVSRVFIN